MERSVVKTNKLKAMNVFVDTSIFICNNYNYTNHSFIALKKAIVEGYVKLLITDVTIEEVKVHIIEDIEKSLSVLKSFRDKAKILKNVSTFKSLMLDNIDQETVKSQLVSQFEQFLKDTNSIYMSVEKADTKFVFDCYFKKMLPFGEGKKKSEFPDAFVLSTLNNWAESLQEDLIVVISKDPEMNGIGNQFSHLSAVDSLDKFLDKVTSHFEKLAPIAQQLLKENIKVIERQIEEQFEMLGFILADQDGEVVEIRVKKINKTTEYLIALNHEKNEDSVEAQFELDAIIKYEADITYDNMETAIYDSEDKELYPWETIDTTVDCFVKIQVDLALLFNTNNLKKVEIKNLNLHNPKDVMVYAEDSNR